MIEFGCLSHVGLRRKYNEDTYYGDSELGVWLVADGMGEGEQGAMASALAREVIMRAISNDAPLAHALHLANEEVTRFSRQHRQQQQRPGCTLAAAHVLGKNLHIAVVGDSRAYLWHHYQLIRPCHTPETLRQLIKQGFLAAEIVNENEQANGNRATQAMGVTEPEHLQLAHVTVQLQTGMQLLLCSDGLTETLNDRALADLLTHAQQNQYGAQECVDYLVSAALHNGGQDNITAVMVQWHGGS